MATNQRVWTRFLFVLGVFAAWSVASISHAETQRIPDPPRNWTHRDGRVKQLRFVDLDGEFVTFQDVACQNAYRVRFDELSEADQTHINALSKDGSRIWTKQDGRSRRLRLVASDGETAVFQLPNDELGMARVSDFAEADRRLLEIAARDVGPANGVELAFVAAVQSDDAATPATADTEAKPAGDAQAEAAPALLPAAVQSTLVETLKNPAYKADWDMIGSDATFNTSYSDAGFVVVVVFGKLSVDEASAQAKLDELLAKMRDEIVEKLQIKTADEMAFKLKLNLGEKNDDGDGPGIEPTNDGCCECVRDCRRCRLLHCLSFLRQVRIRRCCWE